MNSLPVLVRIYLHISQLDFQTLLERSTLRCVQYLTSYERVAIDGDHKRYVPGETTTWMGAEIGRPASAEVGEEAEKAETWQTWIGSIVE